jgi:hypothetical protein
MARFHSWQRGAADIVSVAVGLTLMAVVFAGTTASFLYGREALIREEHFKAVAYLLRGQMEEVQTAIAIVDNATNANSSRNVLSENWYNYPAQKIAGSSREEPISVTIGRKATRVDLPETGDGDDYYLIEMRAQWRERDLAENGRNGLGKFETLSLKTAFVARRGL